MTDLCLVLAHLRGSPTYRPAATLPVEYNTHVNPMIVKACDELGVPHSFFYTHREPQQKPFVMRSLEASKGRARVWIHLLDSGVSMPQIASACGMSSHSTIHAAVKLIRYHRSPTGTSA
jgi:hypothetical protein